MMEELKIQFYAVFQTALICFDLSFSNSRFWSVKFLLSVAKEKKEKGDKKNLGVAGMRKRSAGAEPFFRLKWNGEGKKSIEAGGNVSDAVRTLWVKKEESTADNSQGFLSCVSSPTDVSCHAYLVNPPFSCFSLCRSSPVFMSSLLSRTCSRRSC